MPHDPTTYLGSARHYGTGRPPYSAQLESVLVQLLGLDGTGRLLDVGCGPGTLALRLASIFEDVVGLDPDREMLAEAARVAAAERVTNARWVKAVAEELPAAAPGPYRLVTFGQSMHRTQEAEVAEVVYDLLEPRGALVIVVHTVQDRPCPPNPGYPPIPHEELDAVVERFLGSTRRSGQGYSPVRTHRFEDVLERTRFEPPTSIFAPGRPDLVRDIEGVLSGYFSMSYSAPHLYGERLDDFSREVRQLLASRSTNGLFWHWPGDTEIILARKDPTTRRC